MAHSLQELADIARDVVSRTVARDEAGDWRFLFQTDARPLRIAKLRQSGMSSAEIISEFTELTPVSIKAARIASYLTPDDLLSRLDLLETPAHEELVLRLHELAVLLHEGRSCCTSP